MGESAFELAQKNLLKEHRDELARLGIICLMMGWLTNGTPFEGVLTPLAVAIRGIEIEGLEEVHELYKALEAIGDGSMDDDHPTLSQMIRTLREDHLPSEEDE